MENKKYKCMTCNFSCEYLAHWNEHLETKKHKNNGKRVRGDGPKNTLCDICNYNASCNKNLKLHKLLRHGTPDERKKELKYYCDKCDFGTEIKILFERHLETEKHKS